MDASLTLWFSRLVLGKAIPDSHALHTALWRGFAAESRPFLYRADAVRDDNGRFRSLKVLVQSEMRADWSSLENVVEQHQVEHSYRFATGQRFRFLVRANPTRSSKGSHEPRTKDLQGQAFRDVRGVRVPVRGFTAQLEWLERQGRVRTVERKARPDGPGEKLVTGGFQIEQTRRDAQSTPEVWASSHHRLHGFKEAAGQRHRLVHEGVDLEGILAVTDAAAFANTVRLGMGKARAFGFGLLSLAPLDSVRA